MKRLIISLSLLAVWLGACNSEYDEPGKDKVAMTFKVTGQDGAPETRMSYGGTSDEELSVIWDVAPNADVIGLFNTGTSQNVACPVKTANGNQAEFEDATLEWATQPSGPTPVYAYYPHQASATDAAAVPIDISNQRVQGSPTTIKTNHFSYQDFGSYDFMAASEQVDIQGTTSSTSQLNLHFKHLLHLLTFKVSAPYRGTLVSISLSTTDGSKPFYTKATVDLTQPSYPLHYSTDQASESITLNIDGVSVEKYPSYYYFNLLVLPFDEELSSCKITLTYSEESDGKVYIMTKDLSAKPFKAEGGKHSLFDCTNTNEWEWKPFSQGNGTKDSPYLLSSAQDLKRLSNTPVYNKYFKLTQDIQLNPDEEWTPINRFVGTFDGDGHTVSGMKITQESEACGLFGEISGIAPTTIKHLNVEGTINVQASPNGEIHAGGCVGKAMSTLSIIACSFKGDISVTRTSSSSTSLGIRVGGILGYISSANIEVIACYYRGSNLKSTHFVSGIAGSTPKVLKACYSLATQLVGPSQGGLGNTASNSLTIKHCYWLHIEYVDGFSNGITPATCSDFTGSSFFDDSKLNEMNNEITSTGYKFVRGSDSYPVIQKIN